MELRLLRSFVAVAEDLHFGRAARRLHISQPPLSAQIRRLEADIGVLLFERSRRGVALTDAGAALLGRARRILSDAERAREETRRTARGESGVLTVGYTLTASYRVLPRLVTRLRARHPDVRLELTEMRSALLPEALRSGRIEVGFVCAPVDAPGLRQRPLVRERLVAALPARHPLAGRAHVPVRQLAGQPFVLVRPEIEPGWALRSAAALRRAGVDPQVVQVTDSKIALLGLVAAGLGVSVVSESTSSLGRAGVVLRPITGLPVRLTLSVLFTERPSPRAADLLDAATELFAPV